MFIVCVILHSYAPLQLYTPLSCTPTCIPTCIPTYTHKVTSGVLSPKHGALLDTLALHMLHLKPHTTTHQPHTSMPTPSTGGYQPPRGGILGARGLLGTLQVALAHADAVLDLDTQLRGALGGGSIGGGSIGGGSTGATVRTTWHADQAPQAPQAPQRASHKDASQSNAVGVLNGCVTTGNPSMSALDVCALVRDGQQHTLPGVEGVLESGTRVHAHWVQTCAGNVACVRCVCLCMCGCVGMGIRMQGMHTCCVFSTRSRACNTHTTHKKYTHNTYPTQVAIVTCHTGRDHMGLACAGWGDAACGGFWVALADWGVWELDTQRALATCAGARVAEQG